MKAKTIAMSLARPHMGRRPVVLAASLERLPEIMRKKEADDMKGLSSEERQRLGALLDHTSQAGVMAKIPPFSQAEVHNLAPAPVRAPESLGVLMFNMERGVYLDELGDFLEHCPAVRPFDVILANELDDGRVRSGGKNNTLELAERLGMNAVFGLEFIELVNGADPKGFHGNAIFSRWPIRRAQLEAALAEAEALFPGMPVILGGVYRGGAVQPQCGLGLLRSEPEAISKGA